MDLLHGDVPDDELEAACAYEYARESDIICALASINKKASEETIRSRPLKAKQWKKRGFPHEVGGPSGLEAYLAATQRFEFDPPLWFMEDRWRYIWDCPLFPGKSWLELDVDERTLIGAAFGKDRIKPLATHDVAFIDSMGVPTHLQALAKQARHRAKKGDLKKIPPVVQGWPAKKQTKKASWASVLFTIDFTKRKGYLLQQFHAWLELPDVRKFRESHEAKAATGSTGIFEDRLKDLAAWRIYHALGGKAGLNFAVHNRKHDFNGEPRAFHDPRSGQSSKVPLNIAPLYSDEPNFCKAAGRARNFLAKIIPSWKPIESPADRPRSRWTKAQTKKMAQKARRLDAQLAGDAAVFTRTDRSEHERKSKASKRRQCKASQSFLRQKS